MLGKSMQRGDTIIEVILAFAVFALLAVGTITLMNRGTQASQQALESTLTQEVVAGQAETLRFLRESYIADPSASGPAAVFKDINDNRTVASPSPFGAANCTSTIPTGAFAVDPSTAGVVPAVAVTDASAPAYPQVVTVAGVAKAYGVWVEAVKDPTPTPGQPIFIDFHIRACWFSPAGSEATTTGTILRLYVPGT